MEKGRKPQRLVQNSAISIDSLHLPLLHSSPHTLTFPLKLRVYSGSYYGGTSYCCEAAIQEVGTI